MKRVFSLLIMLCMLVGCGSTVSPDDTQEAKTLTLTKMTAEEITTLFSETGFPLDNIIIYTEATDVNELLGRPEQYTSKVNFADSRLEQGDVDDPVGGAIEVFASEEDAKTRFEYIESVSKGVSFLQQYRYLRKNILMRLDFGLTPQQAAEYEAALDAMLSGDKPTPVTIEPEAPPPADAADKSILDQVKDAAAQDDIVAPTRLTRDEMVKKINDVMSQTDFGALVYDSIEKGIHYYSVEGSTLAFAVKESEVNGIELISTYSEWDGKSKSGDIEAYTALSACVGLLFVPDYETYKESVDFDAVCTEKGYIYTSEHVYISQKYFGKEIIQAISFMAPPMP